MSDVILFYYWPRPGGISSRFDVGLSSHPRVASGGGETMALHDLLVSET